MHCLTFFIQLQLSLYVFGGESDTDLNTASNAAGNDSLESFAATCCSCRAVVSHPWAAEEGISRCRLSSGQHWWFELTVEREALRRIHSYRNFNVWLADWWTELNRRKYKIIFYSECYFRSKVRGRLLAEHRNTQSTSEKKKKTQRNFAFQILWRQSKSSHISRLGSVRRSKRHRNVA